jgi:hypothetical protein
MILDSLPELKIGDIVTGRLVYIREVTAGADSRCDAKIIVLRTNGVLHRATIACRMSDLLDFNQFRESAAKTGLILATKTTGRDFGQLVFDALENPGREGFSW